MAKKGFWMNSAPYVNITASTLFVFSTNKKSDAVLSGEGNQYMTIPDL